MTVVYQVEPTGRSEHEVRERLLTERCPSCGANWRRPRAATPRHSGGREYRCEVCGEHFHAQQVDTEGRPVASQGWGLAQQQRKNGPGPTV